jgi:SAM-dependent methyltransferase
MKGMAAGDSTRLSARSWRQTPNIPSHSFHKVQSPQELRLSKDWNQVWKDMMGKRQGVAPDCADLWDEEKHARHYWETIQQLGLKRIMNTLSTLHIHPDSRVLDIGAGPGTLAIPLSGKVCQVTAVEPSPGMMKVLQDNLCDRKITNTLCIQKRWEEVDVDSQLDPPFDAVLAAFSLDMPNIREAVQKMIQVCSGHVYLYWFAGVPSWTGYYQTLWPSLHGISYQPSPKFNVLVRVLWQMGINPRVEFIPTFFPIKYRSLDDAVEELCPEFNVRNDPQREILARFLHKILIPDGDSLVLPHFYMAVKAWWNTKDSICSFPEGKMKTGAR